jgi:DNA-binding IclR family transcriptional regulator
MTFELPVHSLLAQIRRNGYNVYPGKGHIGMASACASREWTGNSNVMTYADPACPFRTTILISCSLKNSLLAQIRRNGYNVYPGKGHIGMASAGEVVVAQTPLPG